MTVLLDQLINIISPGSPGLHQHHGVTVEHGQLEVGHALPPHHASVVDDHDVLIVFTRFSSLALTPLVSLLDPGPRPIRDEFYMESTNQR